MQMVTHYPMQSSEQLLGNQDFSTMEGTLRDACTRAVIPAYSLSLWLEVLSFRHHPHACVRPQR
jgi:hypothetical protein